MRALSFIVALGVLLAMPHLAAADPSTDTWVKFGTTSATKTVSSGNIVVFTFPVGGVNSTLITVTAKMADACFDADTGGAGGTGRATLKLALTAAGSDNAAITVPALITDNTDCIELIRGTYWAQIDTAATASEVPTIVIYGR